MSMIKRHMEDVISNLAEETGYSEDFLMNIWMECLEDGSTTFDEFVAITLECDW